MCAVHETPAGCVQAGEGFIRGQAKVVVLQTEPSISGSCHVHVLASLEREMEYDTRCSKGLS